MRIIMMCRADSSNADELRLSPCGTVALKVHLTPNHAYSIIPRSGSLTARWARPPVVAAGTRVHHAVILPPSLSYHRPDHSLNS